MPKRLSFYIDGKEIGYRLPDDATYKAVTDMLIAERNQIIVTPAVAEVPAVLDDQGAVVTPAVPAVPAVTRPYTPEEVLKLLQDDTWRDAVARTEAKLAANAAAEAAAKAAKLSLG